MVVALSGMVTDPSDKHSRKLSSGMLFKEVLRETDASELQPLKTPVPIDVTEDGIITCVTSFSLKKKKMKMSN